MNKENQKLVKDKGSESSYEPLEKWFVRMSLGCLGERAVTV